MSFEVLGNLSAGAVIHTSGFLAHDRFKPVPAFCDTCAVWRWRIDDACSLMTHLLNGTFIFLSGYMLLYTVDYTWLPKLYKESYSTKQMDNCCKKILAVVVLIHFWMLSVTNFIASKELGHRIFPCIYSCLEKDEPFFFCIFCPSANVFWEFPISSCNSVIISFEWRAVTHLWSAVMDLWIQSSTFSRMEPSLMFSESDESSFVSSIVEQDMFILSRPCMFPSITWLALHICEAFCSSRSTVMATNVETRIG